jgi:hypothetical protein
MNRPTLPSRTLELTDLDAILEARIREIFRNGSDATAAQTQEIINEILAANPGASFGFTASADEGDGDYYWPRYYPHFTREMTDAEYSAAMAQYEAQMAQYREYLNAEIASTETRLNALMADVATLAPGSLDFNTTVHAIGQISSRLGGLRAELR